MKEDVENAGHDHVARGQMLLQVDRPADAEVAFRAAVAAAPDDPYRRAHLALCLSLLRKRKEALAEAEQAVSFGPDVPYAHYARASVLDDLDRLKEAEKAVLEAIRLDPDDADHHALLASLQAQRSRWSAALKSADDALAIEPEHAGASNLRALALVHLGRRGEAEATVRDALSRDPEDATTHANRGWALLHEGRSKEAIGHFREALRIDPNLEWARMGIVEALKARFFLYRWFLRVLLWMGRFPPAVRWTMIIGIYVAQKGLAALDKSHPELRPFVAPIAFVIVVFVLLTWIGNPLFNLLLRFSREGRNALSPDQKRSSAWFGWGLLTLVALILWMIYGRDSPRVLGGILVGVLVLVVVGSLRLPRGPKRRGAWGVAAVTLACGGTAIWKHFTEAAPPTSWVVFAFLGFLLFAILASRAMSARA
jgi:tetratricopeptide (TPR) repeat protein